MSQDEELVRLMSGVSEPRIEVLKDVDTDDLNGAMQQMLQLLGRAVAAYVSQNTRDADIVARAAMGLYTAAKRFASEDLRPLRVVANTVALYAPMTRSLVYLAEARYSAALAETEKARGIVNEALGVVADYSKSPEAEPEIQEIFEPMLMIMRILFDAFDAQIQGEMAAIHGDLGTYLKLLREGADNIQRGVEHIPPSDQEVVHQLMAMSAAIADRMHSKFENLSLLPAKRYLEPIGDRVFIVHGHDEAKWRELRDLLKDRFKLDPVVLKEEPAGGETLIAKFEEYADQCSYAFVLLTPDDFVEKNGKKYFQARPNVLFELGWFCGHFGRDHIAIVKKADTELPSDLNGLVTIDFKENIAEAVIHIEGELRRIGILKQPKKRSRRAKASGADRALA